MARRGVKPGSKRRRRGGYALAFLEPGESKVVPLEGTGKRDVAHLSQCIRCSANMRRDMQFTVMSLPNGVYVRRLA